MKYVIFGDPGIQLIIKLKNPLQDHKSHHIVQFPKLKNMFFCPVRAIRIPWLPGPSLPLCPYLLPYFLPHQQIIDIHYGNALKYDFQKLNISPQSLGFQTFRLSGATFAFGHTVSLQIIMSNELQPSSAVWIHP